MVKATSRLLCLLLALFCGQAAWAGEAHWIDVRTADEYAQKHVPGAVNIPYEDIVARIGEVTGDTGDLIYVYCRSGRRSGIALDSLTAAGYSNVVNAGGLQEALEKAEQQDLD